MSLPTRRWPARRAVQIARPRRSIIMAQYRRRVGALNNLEQRIGALADALDRARAERRHCAAEAGSAGGFAGRQDRADPESRGDNDRLRPSRGSHRQAGGAAGRLRLPARPSGSDRARARRSAGPHRGMRANKEAGGLRARRRAGGRRRSSTTSPAPRTRSKRCTARSATSSTAWPRSKRIFAARRGRAPVSAGSADLSTGRHGSPPAWSPELAAPRHLRRAPGRGSAGRHAAARPPPRRRPSACRRRAPADQSRSAARSAARARLRAAASARQSGRAHRRLATALGGTPPAAAPAANPASSPPPAAPPRPQCRSRQPARRRAEPGEAEDRERRRCAPK